jgi:hypothetical protein
MAQSSSRCLDAGNPRTGLLWNRTSKPPIWPLLALPGPVKRPSREDRAGRLGGRSAWPRRPGEPGGRKPIKADQEAFRGALADESGRSG